jgi:hypothetical protein
MHRQPAPWRQRRFCYEQLRSQAWSRPCFLLAAEVQEEGASAHIRQTSTLSI